MRNIDYSNKTKKQLEVILDRVFSNYIRIRNADINGFIRCITCGKQAHWKRADCGHYVKRGHSGTRFNEQNCGEQCHFCNRMRNGEEQAHRMYIEKTYGEGTSDLLKQKGRFPFTMTEEEYIEKINYYRLAVETAKYNLEAR